VRVEVGCGRGGVCERFQRVLEPQPRVRACTPRRSAGRPQLLAAPNPRPRGNRMFGPAAAACQPCLLPSPQTLPPPMQDPPFVPAIAFTAMAAGDLLAQSNTTPGLDLRLFDTHGIQQYRRTGTFPNGVQAIGAWTTCCNPGSVRIPFTAAMNPNHGFIHYI